MYKRQQHFSPHVFGSGVRGNRTRQSITKVNMPSVVCVSLHSRCGDADDWTLPVCTNSYDILRDVAMEIGE